MGPGASCFDCHHGQLPHGPRPRHGMHGAGAAVACCCCAACVQAGCAARNPNLNVRCIIICLSEQPAVQAALSTHTDQCRCWGRRGVGGGGGCAQASVYTGYTGRERMLMQGALWAGPLARRQPALTSSPATAPEPPSRHARSNTLPHHHPNYSRLKPVMCAQYASTCATLLAALARAGARGRSSTGLHAVRARGSHNASRGGGAAAAVPVSACTATRPAFCQVRADVLIPRKHLHAGAHTRQQGAGRGVGAQTRGWCRGGCRPQCGAGGRSAWGSGGRMRSAGAS